MAKRSSATNAIFRAHGNLSKAFERARTNMADIPFMHEEVDPRTYKKHMAEAKSMDLHMRGIQTFEDKGSVATENSKPEPKGKTPTPKLRPLPKPNPLAPRKQEGIPGGQSGVNISTNNYYAGNPGGLTE